MQSVSKITIPELEMYGYSSINAVKALLLLFGYELSQLKQKYPINNINDLHGYKASMLENTMHSIATYIMVVEECQDYVVASSIIRMLMDSISVYHLIYHADNTEETLLRHYLYILDGVEEKLNIASRHPLQKTDKITEKEYEALSLQLSSMQNNLIQVTHVCHKEIRKLDIYNSRKIRIEGWMKNGMWKFKTFDNKAYYHWSELHDLLPSKFKKLNSDIGRYLSQHVHRLSMSNLVLDTTNKDIYESLSTQIILILNFIHESMINDFGVDIQFLTEGFAQSVNFPAFLSFCNKKYQKTFFEGLCGINLF